MGCNCGKKKSTLTTAVTPNQKAPVTPLKG